MVCKGWYLRDIIQEKSRLSLYSFQTILLYFTILMRINEIKKVNIIGQRQVLQAAL